MAEKTEAPTPRRREEARRKGQVAKSVEVNSAVVLLAGFYVLKSAGPRSAGALSSLMQRSFTVVQTVDLSVNTLRSGGLAVAGLMAQAIAPLLLTIILAGIVANLAQVGFMFSLQALKPDLNRINPLTGLKRIFSLRGIVELLKSLLKLVIISLVVYGGLRDNYASIVSASRMSLAASLGQLSQVGMAVGLRVATVMIVIAAADYLFQRYEFQKNLRMTRQELIEEMKHYENVQLKSRIRARQRQLAMSRMMAAVPQADVVITNPTFIAVALRYDRGKMGAPQVLAKGQRLIAERIKLQARQHDVPLVENKPLARALFKSVDVGQEIPVSLYQAVAEVLAFVYRLKPNGRLGYSMAGQ